MQRVLAVRKEVKVDCLQPSPLRHSKGISQLKVGVHFHSQQEPSLTGLGLDPHPPLEQRRESSDGLRHPLQDPARWHPGCRFPRWLGILPYRTYSWLMQKSESAESSKERKGRNMGEASWMYLPKWVLLNRLLVG